MPGSIKYGYFTLIILSYCIWIAGLYFAGSFLSKGDIGSDGAILVLGAIGGSSLIASVVMIFCVVFRVGFEKHFVDGWFYQYGFLLLLSIPFVVSAYVALFPPSSLLRFIGRFIAE